MSLSQSGASIDEERIEAPTGLVDDRPRSAPRDLVAPPDHEGLEGAARSRLRDRLQRCGFCASRRSPDRCLDLERPVDEEPQARSLTRRAFDRLCECAQMMLANPLEAEGTGYLNGELPGLEASRPQRSDPSVEVLGEQASTELPSHLPPDGVEHPPTPRCSDRHSDFSRRRDTALST